MPKINSLTYLGLDGEARQVELSKPDVEHDAVHFTFLTGRNGSHKSTILRQLVASHILPSERQKVIYQPSTDGNVNSRIICFSGSVADRFPLKERGALRTPFDVPDYVYVGQMVGPNLLSKKQPMATVIQFASDKAVWARCTWPFFAQAFEFAGVKPSLVFRLRPRSVPQKILQYHNDSYDFIVDRANNGPLTDGRSRGEMSPKTAQHLLRTFPRRIFFELDAVLFGKQRIGGELTSDGITPTSNSAECIRLGLLSNFLVLADCKVESNTTGEIFSAFELSSGEYHMLTAILALGFSLTEDAVVLVDEPENSLHPQWQQDFMSALIELTDKNKLGHIIVATHSPLIVSAAPQGSTIVDLAAKQPFAEADEVSFGSSADDVLFERFGLASSRNRMVIAKIQEAITLVEQGLELGEDFRKLRPELSEILRILPKDDPLVEILDALLDEAVRS